MEENILISPKKGLNAFQLKLIACILMLFDHFAVSIIFYSAYSTGSYCGYNFSNGFSTAYTILRTLGRFSFPIFCFFIVEGYSHTKNRFKYATRLLICGILSEVPFDLALMEGTVFNLKHNNVFWTLLIGLICIWIIDVVREQREGFLGNDLYNALVCVVLIALCMFVAWACKTDYNYSGVGAIVIMYIFKKAKPIGTAAAIIFLGLTSSWLEFFALPVVLLVYLYNGEQGPYNKFIKWAFYLFYPIHLGILAFVALKMGIFDFLGGPSLFTTI